MRSKRINNDNRFKKLIENSYSGVSLLTSDFQISYRSTSAERITGWSDKKKSIIPAISHVHPDDQETVKAALKQVLTLPGVPLSSCFRFQHFLGHFIWLETTFTNMLDEPDIKAIVCNFKDITEQKTTELKLKDQTQQITELLETMTDSFVALDKNLCYTYANQQVAKLLGITVESMIGKHIWSLFPDAVGSATYDAIQKAYTEQVFVINQDFYAPLQLWQENRIYPASGGLSIFIRDITRAKKEEQHLKLLESVITNATDAVLITEAEPHHAQGPPILYVNEAFTKITGYTADEVIGKSPKFLQGPRTDPDDLLRLSEALHQWRPCDVTLLNYKKNGEEFWVDLSVKPVKDESGRYTHWISITRDVTERKNEELRQSLLNSISLVFNQSDTLNILLTNLMDRLVSYGNFILAEIWLVSSDKNKLTLSAKQLVNEKTHLFYEESKHQKSFIKGEGLPGKVWENKRTECFLLSENEQFIRKHAAASIGLKIAYGIPIIADQMIIGVLVLGLGEHQQPDHNLMKWIDELSTRFGNSIVRKQLNQELKQIFSLAPDMICSIDTDMHFKKVNPAMCQLMEYTEAEIMNRSLFSMVHPDDRSYCAELFKTFEQTTIHSFEIRLVSKSGKLKWISWTVTQDEDANLILSVGKDITEKKELEVLFHKVTELAQVGSWELDLKKNKVYWSKITKDIHEVDADFEPDLKNGISFYKNSDDRAYISKLITMAIEKGSPFDFELPIITANGRTKWVRVIGETDFIDGECLRVYGSFQDVDARVKAEILANDALQQKSMILESIGDAFFAVDKNWTINYWNNMAEKVLNFPKKEIIGKNLWDVFPEAVGSKSYIKYLDAVKTKLPVQFEDYSSNLDKWYEINAYPATNGLSVYLKDITERKLSEKLLADSQKKYSQLFQLSPLPKWVFDLETLQILDVNMAAIKHYGFTRTEFLSMTIKDIRPADHIPILFDILEKHQSKHQFKIPDAITHQKKMAS